MKEIKNRRASVPSLDFLASLPVSNHATTKEGAAAHIRSYKSLAFFVERTEEAIQRSTALIIQLDAEITRLRYEVTAMQNEYKNIKMVLADRDESLKPRSS